MSALDNEQGASTRRPETWAEHAATRAGSSRGNYDEWLAARSRGLKRTPKRAGGPDYKAQAKEPGSYAHAR